MTSLFKKKFRRSTKTDNRAYNMPQILKAITLGLLVMVVLLLLFSFVLSKWDISLGMLSYLTIFALIIGCVVSGYYISTRKKEKGMFLGALAGGAIFLVTLVAALLSGSSISTLAFIKLVIAVSSGAIGGIIGVNKKNKRHFS